MNIAYFGTPEISARLLEQLLKHKLPISYVVTQPDMPVGKRLQITPSPVKQVCQSHDIAYFDKPLSKNTREELVRILDNKRIDLCILFAYGELISPALLNSIKYGFWNIHPSLLPRYRGASPTVYPMLLGESSTGVTLMKMNEGLDEGEIIMQESFEISQAMMRQDIEERSIEIAANQIISEVSSIEALSYTKQDPDQATYTRKITKADGFIEFSYIQGALQGIEHSQDHPMIYMDYFKKNRNISIPDTIIPAAIINQMHRALSPWPGIWTKIQINGVTKRLKLTSVQKRQSKLIIERVQLEGKSETDFATFQRAYNVFREKR